jgi:hypothetical protein
MRLNDGFEDIKNHVFHGLLAGEGLLGGKTVFLGGIMMFFKSGYG